MVKERDSRGDAVGYMCECPAMEESRVIGTPLISGVPTKSTPRVNRGDETRATTKWMDLKSVRIKNQISIALLYLNHF